MFGKRVCSESLKNIVEPTFRTSHREVFCEKAVKKIPQIVFLINLQANRFIIAGIWQKRFHVNFVKFTRAAFLFNPWLLLYFLGNFFPIHF